MKIVKILILISIGFSCLGANTNMIFNYASYPSNLLVNCVATKVPRKVIEIQEYSINSCPYCHSLFDPENSVVIEQDTSYYGKTTNVLLYLKDARFQYEKYNSCGDCGRACQVMVTTNLGGKKTLVLWLENLKK